MSKDKSQNKSKTKSAEKSKSTKDDNKAGSRNEEILRAATSIFARYGYRNADVQLIADELGIGKGTIYRTFPTKQDLFFAAVDRGLDRFDEYMNQCMDKYRKPNNSGEKACSSKYIIEGVDYSEVLESAIRHYLKFFEDNADLVELFIQERAEFRDREQASYFSHKEKKIEKPKEFFQKLIEQEKIKNISAECLDDVVTQLLYGTLFVHYFSRREKPLSSRADDIINVLIKGLLKHR